MSPREALRRLTFFVPAASSPVALNTADIAVCHTRMAGVAAEIAAVPETIDTPTKDHRLASAPKRFIATDIFALCAGFLAAWGAAGLIDAVMLGQAFDLTLSLMRLVPFAVIGAGCMAWFAVTGHYRKRQPFWAETQKIIKTMSLGLVIDGFSQFISHQDPSRLWLVSAWLFAMFFLMAGRMLARTVMRRKGLWGVRTLLVGSGKMADATRAALRSEPALGYDVVMQIENLPLLFSQAGNSWRALCARFQAEAVVLAMDGKALAEARDALSRLTEENVSFSVVPPAYPLLSSNMSVQHFLGHDVVAMAHDSGLEQPFARGIKRAIDIVGACAGLVLFAPVMIVSALFVAKDGGVIFFGHKRLGMGGKSFECLKFRSMVQNGDEVLDRYFAENPAAAAEWDSERKLREDPRVTRIGAFLRATSLDELPQLLNVLKGDMSLVGPRPIVAEEVEKYRNAIVHYYRVRPGITGVWQVSGRNDVSYAQRVQMDSWYVRNWSLWQDVAILAKTIPAVLKGTGAR